MPYGISSEQSDCAGYAAVKIHDDGSVETIGCHENKQDAIDQMVAVSIAEDIEPVGDIDVRVLPDNYRPALSDDVPEGRACGNCVHYEHDDAHGEGDDEMAYCSRWNDYVYANFYCNAYVIHEADHDEQRVVDLSLPDYIRDAAVIGLEYNAEGLAGDGLTDKTVREARLLADGQVSEDKVVRANAWAERHAVDLDAAKNSDFNNKDFPGAGAVAHYLWGINPLDPQPAREWYARKSEQVKAERAKAPLQDNGKTRNAATMYDKKDMETMINTAHWVSSALDKRRSVAYTTLELRAEGDGNTFVGYAALFDSPSEPMPFVEYVRAGAFTKTLNDGADVRLLIDHEGVPLARTKSGTLMLEEDDRGLRVEAELDPMNPDAQRVISAMRRGDLSQMSFAFRTVKDSFSADGMVRELREVQLFDVSVVTYPAYEDTIAELRRAQPVTVETAGSLLVRKRQIQIARQR